MKPLSLPQTAYTECGLGTTLTVQGEGMGSGAHQASGPGSHCRLEGIPEWGFLLLLLPLHAGLHPGLRNPRVTGSSSPPLPCISASLSRTGVPEQLKQTSPHLGLGKRKQDLAEPPTMSGSGRILPGWEGKHVPTRSIAPHWDSGIHSIPRDAPGSSMLFLGGPAKRGGLSLSLRLVNHRLSLPR